MADGHIVGPLRSFQISSRFGSLGRATRIPFVQSNESLFIIEPKPLHDPATDLKCVQVAGLAGNRRLDPSHAPAASLRCSSRPVFADGVGTSNDAFCENWQREVGRTRKKAPGRRKPTTGAVLMIAERI